MALTEPEWTHTHKEYQALRERTKLVQFLLALTDFTESLPSVHDILPELLVEQSMKGIIAPPPSDVLHCLIANIIFPV